MRKTDLSRSQAYYVGGQSIAQKHVVECVFHVFSTCFWVKSGPSTSMYVVSAVRSQNMEGSGSTDETKANSSGKFHHIFSWR